MRWADLVYADINRRKDGSKSLMIPDSSFDHLLNLTIPQRLQQFLNILQMSRQELQKFIEEQSVENPAIEIESLQIDFEQYECQHQKIQWFSQSNEYNRPGEENNDIFSLVSESNANGLYDYLLFQLNQIPLNYSDRQVAKIIIHSIDENGYLSTGLDFLSKYLRISETDIDRILRVIQRLSPPGIGARDLKECLLLQLDHKYLTDENIYKIINSYLDSVDSCRPDIIAREIGITVNEAKAYIDLIRSLNPKPGSALSARSEMKCIIPDIIVKRTDNDLVVTQNSVATQYLTINNNFVEVLKSSDNEGFKNEIYRDINHAMWITDCIRNRYDIILKVAKYIVNAQKNFLLSGQGSLVPLSTEDIAEEFSVPEIYIHRSVREKYMQSEWGIFSMEEFFPDKNMTFNINTNNPADKAKAAVKIIIESESRKKPYSDQKLVDILNDNGIVLTRRTVAKYRKEMTIPNSTARKGSDVSSALI